MMGLCNELLWIYHLELFKSNLCSRVLRWVNDPLFMQVKTLFALYMQRVFTHWKWVLNLSETFAYGRGPIALQWSKVPTIANRKAPQPKIHSSPTSYAWKGVMRVKLGEQTSTFFRFFIINQSHPISIEDGWFRASKVKQAYTTVYPNPRKAQLFLWNCIFYNASERDFWQRVRPYSVLQHSIINLYRFVYADQERTGERNCQVK